MTMSTLFLNYYNVILQPDNILYFLGNILVVAVMIIMIGIAIVRVVVVIVIVA
jgi:hypothetical protein